MSKFKDSSEDTEGKPLPVKVYKLPVRSGDVFVTLEDLSEENKKLAWKYIKNEKPQLKKMLQEPEFLKLKAALLEEFPEIKTMVTVPKNVLVF